MLLNTADELLDKLSTDGGVIVGTNKLHEIAIADARVCGRMYVNADGLGFVLLPNCVAHPNFSQPEGCSQ